MTSEAAHPAKLGGCLFEEGDLAEYDPMTGLARLFLDQDQVFTGAGPGVILMLSTCLPTATSSFPSATPAQTCGIECGSATSGLGLEISLNYDPVNKTASIFFNQDWFVNPDSYTNIDAVLVYNLLMPGYSQVRVVD